MNNANKGFFDPGFKCGWVKRSFKKDSTSLIESETVKGKAKPAPIFFRQMNLTQFSLIKSIDHGDI